MPFTGETMSLAILLTTSPEHEDVHTVIRLAEAARTTGRSVRIFLMADGIYALNVPKLRELAAHGVEIAVCAHNAAERSFPQPPDFPHLLWGSQYDFAQMTASCERVLAFT